MKRQEKTLEGRIRDAVASGEFGKARALWIELGDRLRSESALHQGSAARLRQARDLLAWCRTMALADRTRCQQRLNQLAIAARYLAESTPPKQRMLVRM